MTKSINARRELSRNFAPGLRSSGRFLNNLKPRSLSLSLSLSCARARATAWVSPCRRLLPLHFDRSASRIRRGRMIVTRSAGIARVARIRGRRPSRGHLSVSVSVLSFSRHVCALLPQKNFHPPDERVIKRSAHEAFNDRVRTRALYRLGVKLGVKRTPRGSSPAVSGLKAARFFAPANARHARSVPCRAVINGCKQLFPCFPFRLERESNGRRERAYSR